MKRSFLSFIFLATIVSVSSSRQGKGSIAGIVRDSVSHTPLAGANVVLQGTVRGTTTSAKGEFRVGAIPEGTYTVVATMIGYEPQSVAVRLQPSDTPAMLELFLKPSPVRADQVVVTASRHEQSLQDVPVSMTVVDAHTLAERSVVTVDEALRYVSGVNMTLDQVNIRGSSGYSRGIGSRVLVLIDGLPYITGDTGEISWEAMPVYQIDRIEVVKGAGSALYGSSALGGVINIITRPIPERPDVRLKLSGGVYDQPRYAEWRWGGGPRRFASTLVSLSSRSGPFGALLSVTQSEDDGYRVNDVAHRWNFFAKSAYALTSTRELAAMANINLRRHGNFFYWKSLRDATRPADDQLGGIVNSNRGNLNFAFREIVSDEFFYSIKATYVGNFWQDDSAGRVNNTSASHVTRLEAQGTWNEGAAGIFTAGIAANYDRVVSDIFGSHPGVGSALYGQWEYGLLPTLRLTAGARIDWEKVSALASAERLDPKLAVTWNASPATTFRASAGSGFRYPSISELYTSVTTGVSAVRIVPNLDLKPERSWSFEAGMSHAITDRVRIDAALFQNDFTDLIEAGVDPAEFVIRFDNVTRARIRGAELNLTSDWFNGTVELSAGYTYLDPVDRTTGQTLKFRPRHLATGTLTCAAGVFRITATGRAASRMETIDENLVQLAPIIQGDARVPVQVFDVAASAELTQVGLPVRVGLNVKNLTNYSYVELIGNLAPVRSFSMTIDAAF